MASPSQILLLLACVLASSFCFSMATRFDVGGKDGWVVKPSESYDHWAQRLRFLVNDSLVFRYKQGSDSVVQVKKEDFDSCNTSNKLKVMKSGTSVFKFPQSGPFYFISGNKKQCLAGQKLVVVVLAVRTPKPPATPTPPPSSAPALPPTKTPPPSAAPALPPTATPPPSAAPGTPKLAPQPPTGASPPSAASSPGTAPPNAPWNSPAGQPGASSSGPSGSPDTADQSSPPVASRNSTSSSAVAAVVSPALVAVGLGFAVLFM